MILLTMRCGCIKFNILLISSLLARLSTALLHSGESINPDTV